MTFGIPARRATRVDPVGLCGRIEESRPAVKALTYIVGRQLSVMAEDTRLTYE